MRTCLLLVALTAAVAAQTPAAPSPKDIDVYGQRIHYLEAGSSGPVIILLHGLGVDSTSWAFNTQALGAKYHVYVPDQIGFGQSAKPLMNYRVGTMVDFLDAFMKAVKIPKATLIGNSLGGWIAMSYTLAHPDKVERLVLVDSGGFSPKRLNAPIITREQLLALNPSTLEGMRVVLNAVLYNKAFITDALVEQAFTAQVRNNAGYTVNQFIDSMMRGEDFVDGRLGNIRVPTLIVWGRNDVLTPLPVGDALKADLPGAELIVYDRCGHTPQMEKAVDFNADILKWLAK